MFIGYASSFYLSLGNDLHGSAGRAGDHYSMAHINGAERAASDHTLPLLSNHGYFVSLEKLTDVRPCRSLI